jgi:hypothetical protein
MESRGELGRATRSRSETVKGQAHYHTKAQSRLPEDHATRREREGRLESLILYAAMKHAFVSLLLIVLSNLHAADAPAPAERRSKGDAAH